VFSTVLQNTQMLYSKKNYKLKNENVELNSFYQNYINDALHSGIKKFNFIPIKRDSSLILNIDTSKFKNAKTLELTYYYIPNINREVLINIDKNKIIRKTVSVNLPPLPHD
jgi:hypothetical protein